MPKSNPRDEHGKFLSKKVHPFLTPRSTLAIALVGIVLSGVQPLMPSVFAYFIIIVAYVCSAAIFVLFVKEIKLAVKSETNSVWNLIIIDKELQINILLSVTIFIVASIALIRHSLGYDYVARAPTKEEIAGEVSRMISGDNAGARIDVTNSVIARSKLDGKNYVNIIFNNPGNLDVENATNSYTVIMHRSELTKDIYRNQFGILFDEIDKNKSGRFIHFVPSHKTSSITVDQGEISDENLTEFLNGTYILTVMAAFSYNDRILDKNLQYVTVYCANYHKSFESYNPCPGDYNYFKVIPRGLLSQLLRAE